MNKDSGCDDSLLRFNLSGETKIDDLFVKFAEDNSSLSGLKIEEGPFFRAYRRGHKILMDHINLAPREALECIQQALDTKILSVELPGKVLEKFRMHPNFGIIATQNPNNGAFANKRQELGIEFLSRFKIIHFPNFTRDELMEIAWGLAKLNNYNRKDVITDIVSFHMDWQEEENLVDDIQCFTIREIESVIRAIAQEKNIYDTIMTVYGGRYQKDKKDKLRKKLKLFQTLKNLKPSSFKLPKEFPHSYSNDNLCEAVSSALFSLTNERNIILVGEDGSGITQIARWCADCFNNFKNKEKNDFKNESCLCLCTNNLKISDIIGPTSYPKRDNSESNEILKFIPGFLTVALETGKVVVFDCINEVNPIIGERLNGLLDKKIISEEEVFDIPENTERRKIPIHKDFRMICTCNINNIKDMSPAFVNRFDIIFLENQLESLNNNQLAELISNLFISFDRIPLKKKRINLLNKQSSGSIFFNDNDENEENEENEEKENEIIYNKESKEEIILKEKEFLSTEKDMIKKIVNKINILSLNNNDENKSGEYPHIRTISSLSRFCYGIMKL